MSLAMTRRENRPRESKRPITAFLGVEAEPRHSPSTTKSFVTGFAMGAFRTELPPLRWTLLPWPPPPLPLPLRGSLLPWLLRLPPLDLLLLELLFLVALVEGRGRLLLLALLFLVALVEGRARRLLLLGGSLAGSPLPNPVVAGREAVAGAGRGGSGSISTLVLELELELGAGEGELESRTIGSSAAAPLKGRRALKSGLLPFPLPLPLPLLELVL